MGYGGIFGQKTILDAFTKEQTLSNATAALFGLGPDSVPNDAFAYLGKYAQHWWRRRKPGGVSIVDGDTVQTYNLGAGYSQTRNITVTYSPEAEIVDGNIKIKTEQTLTATYATYTVFEELRGKFIMASEVNDDASVLVKAKENAAVTQRTQSGVYYVDIEATIPKIASIPPGEWEYLYSSDRSAYPDSGEQDGYEYQYLGIPFENAVGAPEIETGSYTGTGTYGASNPNTLTFGFVPKLLIISSPISNDYSNITIIYATRGGVSISGPISSGGSTEVAPGMASSINNNTVSFYNNTSASRQKNESGVLYDYLALG